MTILKIKQYDENLSLLNEGLETTDNIDRLISIIESQLAEGNVLLIQRGDAKNEAIVIPNMKIISTPYKEKTIQTSSSFETEPE